MRGFEPEPFHCDQSSWWCYIWRGRHHSGEAEAGICRSSERANRAYTTRDEIFHFLFLKPRKEEIQSCSNSRTHLCHYTNPDSLGTCIQFAKNALPFIHTRYNALSIFQ